MTGKILIVDEAATNRIVLKVRLASARYQTLHAVTGAEAMAIALREPPDLVLLDLALPDCDAFDLCRRLCATAGEDSLPIMLMAQRADVRSRIAALNAGAIDLLEKPINTTELLARLRALLRARAISADLNAQEGACGDMGFSEPASDYAAPERIALVAGSRESALLWRSALLRHLPGRQITTYPRDDSAQPGEAYETADAYLIAADLGQRNDGLRLLSELRVRAETRHAAVCIAMPEGRAEDAASAFDLGADDLLPGTLPSADLAEEAAARLSRLLAQKRRADHQRRHLSQSLHLAMIDPLTGLHNRRYASQHMARMAQRAGQGTGPVAIMVLDIDRFKSINDTWGHVAGDRVLVGVARRLQEALGAEGMLARIGGEEFLIVLDGASPEAARRIAEQICAAVHDTPFFLGEGMGRVPVTISIGLAIGRDKSVAGANLLITQADHALLASKAEGRDQVTLFCKSAA